MCSIKSQTHSYFIMPDNFFLIMVKITSNSRLLILNCTEIVTLRRENVIGRSGTDVLGPLLCGRKKSEYLGGIS